MAHLRQVTHRQPSVRMSGKPENGRTAARMSALTARRSNAPQFVIASALRQHTLEAFELGVVDYLVKPFSEQRVVQCLRGLLERCSPHPGTIQGPSRIVARRKESLVF